MIKLEGVGREFGTPGKSTFVALSAINLVVDAGEFVSLVGASGCGKSTLLRIIGGLDRPTSGMVRVKEGKARAGFQDIGTVFQRPILLPWLTVLENVTYPARAIGIRGRTTHERARELLDMVGLTRVADQYPDSLSGGMQQRASICRALVLDPNILIMDEPFSALDAMTREELQFELMKLHQKTRKTIIFVTHSISEAILMSTRIVVLAQTPGRITEDIAVGLGFPRTRDALNQTEAIRIDGLIRSHIYGPRTQGA